MFQNSSVLNLEYFVRCTFVLSGLRTTNFWRLCRYARISV